MKLTNIAHLRLPFGRLYGYGVTTSRTGRELPVSFDQARHLEAGDRSGSWTALSLTLPGPVPRDDLSAAWHAVISRHGTLQSVAEPGDGEGPRLFEVEVAPGAWVEHTIGPGQAPNDALREMLDATCRPFSRPSHRLCVLEAAAAPTVVIAADHVHVDMWSMLVLARDLLAQIGGAAAEKAPHLAPAFAEHTAALRERASAPEDVHRRWAEILAASGNVMPRFPLPLGDPSPQPERVEVRSVLDADESASFSAQAREDGVSTLALTVAAMAEVTRELAGTPLRAVFPVHSRCEPTWHDSVGWFITNAVIETDEPSAQAASAAVKEAIRLGSWPLAEIMRPWGGMPEAPGMFAISWLALNRLPVRIDASGLDAQYVSAAIRTNSVMLWFMLDDRGLHLRCRYPDTPEARHGVGRWLDLLVARLQGVARTSAGNLLPVGQCTVRIRRAARADLPTVVALLSDDGVGTGRESDEMARYEQAFDLLSQDPSQFLAVACDANGEVVGTMQLSVIPGLSRGGSARLQLEGVRVAAMEGSPGIGAAMLEWAHRFGRERGATLVQLATDTSRESAPAFPARRGYVTRHVWLERTL